MKTPLSAPTFAERVITGKSAPEATVAEVVQVKLVVPQSVHDQPDPVGTPAGNTVELNELSLTVVTPDTAAVPLLRTTNV